MQREHVHQRQRNSSRDRAARRRIRKQRLYRQIFGFWLLAFVLGLICGKIVFARNTGLLAKAEAGIALEKNQNSGAEASTEGGGRASGEAEGIRTASEEETESWQLTLVNADHPMAEGCRPQVSEIENNYYFDSRAVAELQQMLADGRKEGLDFWICSAYRTIEKQTDLYNDKVSRLQAEGMSYDEAFREAGTVVAYPGTSEHNLGLAADIVARDYQLLDDKQADTAESKWLKENCWRYGFILRYPTDKTKETGIIFEPWHYRYVGKKAAREIMEQGICLEEYLGVS